MPRPHFERVIAAAFAGRILAPRAAATLPVPAHPRRGIAIGIDILTGCDNYIVSGNDTSGNTTGGIDNVPGAAATRIVANNL